MVTVTNTHHTGVAGHLQFRNCVDMLSSFDGEGSVFLGATLLIFYVHVEHRWKPASSGTTITCVQPSAAESREIPRTQYTIALRVILRPLQLSVQANNCFPQQAYSPSRLRHL